MKTMLLTLALTLSACGGDSSTRTVSSEPLPFAWPPVAGEAYPDLELLDSNGELVRLSSFEGKVIMVEPIAMT